MVAICIYDNGSSMVIDLSSLLIFYPHGIDEGVEENLDKWNQLTEDEPYINHLDVGSGRETA